MTAVSLLFLIVLVILGTAASTFTNRTTVAVNRYARRQLTLSAARGAVCEAWRVFESCILDVELDDAGQRRLQSLIEASGATAGLCDDVVFLRGDEQRNGDEGGALLSSNPRFWASLFRDDPGRFEATYRARWALRGLDDPAMAIDVQPVSIRTVFIDERLKGAQVAGTISFQTTATFRGRPRVVRRYEVRRRFVCSRGRLDDVRFLSAPLGIYVDQGIVRGDER